MGSIAVFLSSIFKETQTTKNIYVYIAFSLFKNYINGKDITVYGNAQSWHPLSLAHGYVSTQLIGCVILLRLVCARGEMPCVCE